MARPSLGSVERSMNNLTIGQVKTLEGRKAQRTLEGLIEREEQFQIEFEGNAEEFPTWTEVEIKFETVFANATGQRDADFDRPHFYYGAYVPKGGPIGVFACVTEWNVNDKDETVGCTLSIGAAATDQSKTFAGELHAVFQGYGAADTDYGDIDGTDHK